MILLHLLKELQSVCGEICHQVTGPSGWKKPSLHGSIITGSCEEGYRGPRFSPEKLLAFLKQGKN